MVKPEDIKNIINNSSLTDEQKQRVESLLPKLGSVTLQWLAVELQDHDLNLIFEDLENAIRSCIEALEKMKSGDNSLLLKLLKESPHSAKYNLGKFVIPFVADITTTYGARNAILAEIRSFELALFKDLPEVELQRIVKEDFVYFLKNLNISAEFKRIFYYRNVYDGVNWGKVYASNLERNEELFGTEPLFIDKKKYEPQVKNWLNDFITSLPVPISQRTTFEEVQYLRRSSNASKLPLAEQDRLLAIIKLYRWFLDPVVTRQEVEEYESKLELQLEGQSPVVLPAAPTAPQHLGFGFKKPVADVALPKDSPVAPRPALNQQVVQSAAVMPPLKANPVSVQEILKKVSAATPAVVVTAPQPKATIDVKKAPVGSIEEILRRKKELEEKIDEKIEELKKRVT